MTKLKFSAGEVVLATDKGKQYEAKVLKCQNIGGAKKYFIHFQGWPRKYDVWIDEALMSKVSGGGGTPAKGHGKVMATGEIDRDSEAEDEEASGEEVDEISVESTSRGKKRSADVKDTSSASSGAASGAKDKDRDGDKDFEMGVAAIRKHKKLLAMADLVEDDDEDSFIFKIAIPPQLKRHLVDEWTLIAQESRMLLRLPKPRQSTVSSILQDFLRSKEAKLEEAQFNLYVDLISGLQVYFEKALPKLLLYRQERLQYDKVLVDLTGVNLSDIYGAEHLLRLFVRLPKLISGVCLVQAEMTSIHNKFIELLKFLQKNFDKYSNMEHYASADVAMADTLVMPVDGDADCDKEDGSKAQQTSARKKRKGVQE